MSLPRAESQGVRSAYLRALGIEEWVSRGGESPAAAAVMASAAAPRSGLERAPESLPSPRSVNPASPITAPMPRAAPTPIARLPEASQAAWAELRAEVAGCLRCGLSSTRTQTVFGVGNMAAPWLIIGEAPGAEEDRRGEPFVGRGGQLLDAMLQAIGVRRGDNAFIANILKCRPPGNRDPKPEEVSCCLPYLARQIRLLRPRVILAVGRIAAQNLLNTDVPLGRLRGRVHSFGELNTPLIVTYHPAYLLRTPTDKRKAWEDLKFARATFAQRASMQGAGGVTGVSGDGGAGGHAGEVT